MNAVGAVTWSVVAGSLPPGLTLEAATGKVSGAPVSVGSFWFRIRAQDAAGPSAEVEYTIDVVAGSAFVQVLATANPVCPGQGATLSVPGSFSAYSWLPGGETTPAITVYPLATTDYAVLLTDANGCQRRGFVRIVVSPRAVSVDAPRCVASGQPGYIAATEDAGPGASYAWTILNGSITGGAGSRNITFTAGSSGVVKVSVVVTTAGGCASESAEAAAVIGCGAAPVSLVVDGAPNGVSSDGNGILEPGETAVLKPGWMNVGNANLALTGAATLFTGPAGATYVAADATANYGSIAPGSSADCRQPGIAIRWRSRNP